MFSASDSTPARAIPAASSDSGSRAHRWGIRARAAARSSASSEDASPAPSRTSEVPPSTAHVAAAVTSTSPPARTRAEQRWSATGPGSPAATRRRPTPASTAPPTSTAAYPAPASRESAYTRRSSAAATRPNPATG
ncbi:hypothetical protein GCM10023175_48410 [Pseudonocardia xishanensis]|uniref:Uncharacterized protein n=1 Tax=Pseudonocardia xishanensis TaxID=630995 RepID=A0ABP8RY73_9PSEU